MVEKTIHKLDSNESKPKKLLKKVIKSEILKLVKSEDVSEETIYDHFQETI